MSGDDVSEPELRHACALSLGGRGVLIRGASGSGKSSLLLSLLRRGEAAGLEARLVADDQVIVKREGETVRLHTPNGIAGLLEVRGIGILRLPFAASCRLDLVVDLVERDALERLPGPENGTTRVLGREVERLCLAARDPTFGADVVLTLMGCGVERVATD